KDVCSIWRWYLIESSGVMMVSISRREFQAKTFIGVEVLKLLRISSSDNPSSFIFLQRSLAFMADSSTLLRPSQTFPFLMDDWTFIAFCNTGKCLATASST